MSFAVGTRIGPYEVTGPLGAGGMGEVYRARDPRLNREVAIKVLLPEVVNDRDRLARFTREAQLLASLNHQNIAQVHGVEEDAGGICALVMELVDGETLADRLIRGALPLDESLATARQLADALAAAHELGIVHRDLKPANIKVRPDGTVKVLDFGLAKALDPVGTASRDAALSSTISMHATHAGVILGTAAYMSPEQAKGRVVDRRADLWAFGAVLYEMLSGRRAFAGDDVSDTLVAVLRDSPEWRALPPSTPAPVRRLLQRCLEKDRQRRLDSAAAARLDLDEVTSEPAAASLLGVSTSRAAAYAGAALIAGALLTAAAAWQLMPDDAERRAQTARFAITLPHDESTAGMRLGRDVTVSPDGSSIVYFNSQGDSTQSGIMVRALNDLDGRLLVKGNTAALFMSPDGRWVAYFQGGELKKVPIDGGAPVTICKAAAPRGATWTTDGTIVFASATSAVGLLSVPAAGGEATPLTKPEGGASAPNHSFPSVLPGGRHVLFAIVPPGDVASAEIAVLDRETRQHKVLLRGGTRPEYVDSGHLIYAADDSLWAVGFDLDRLEVTGAPVAVIPNLTMAGTGDASFSISRNGALVYVPSDPSVLYPDRTLVWVDRQGRETPVDAPPRPYAVARLSPDGTRVALDVRDRLSDIWIWEFARRTLTQLNSHPGSDLSPLWTVDGRSIIWTSTRAGTNPNLYRQAADGSGAISRLVTAATALFPVSLTPDGKQVFGNRTGASIELFVLPLPAGDAAPADGASVDRLLVDAGGSQLNPEISPDGRWIAYQSSESGRSEIFVRPYPQVEGGRWLVSSAGGSRPAWTRAANELLYLDADGLLTSVRVDSSGGSFAASAPMRILSTRYYAGFSARNIPLRGYDVAARGERFLMIKDVSDVTPSAPQVVVVLNWLEELKQRVTAR